MRILYCNKYNFRFSGTEAYLFDTMERVRSRGHEAALFAMADERGTATAFDRYLLPAVDFKQRKSFVASARLTAHAIYSTEARRRIRKMIAAFRPDVAHVRNIYHHLSPSILWELKQRGVPVLYHINDFKLICPSYNLVSSGRVCERCQGGKFWNVVHEGCYLGGRLASIALAAEAYVHRWIATYQKCVDLILAPSEFAAQKLIDNGWARDRIRVLPHFQELPPESSPYPGPKAPVLYFGRLSAEKGIEDLLRAVARFPDINLVIGGDGPQRPELEALTRQLHLTHLTFTGHLAGRSLENLIATAQFTVFPSRAYESMGKSILESYAQGRAVVASDLGSRREMVEHGATGLLYPAGDWEQLGLAMHSLQERPELAQRMGEAARERVRERYSTERHLVALEEIYEGLCNGNGFKRNCSNPARSASVKSPPLRIAFIGGRGVVGKYSGIESWYEEAGSRLAEMGYEITVYCRSYFTPNVGEHRGMSIVRLPTIRSKHLETLVHTALSTLHACFSDCEIVHFHALGPSLFSFFPRLFGKKTVVTVQGLDWQRKKWGRVARCALRVGEWASARLPSRTVAVSRTLQGYYSSRRAKECVFVPNGTILREGTSCETLRRFGLERDGYVLYLGRLSPEKNCHLLVEAFEELETPMRLVFAGGSSHTDEYAAKLRQKQSDRIQILEWVSGKTFDALLTNAALFVLPSDMEGMSMALLDAMGANVCVLASDIAENRETLADTGFTFRPGDVNDLRERLRLLLARPELRRASALRARDRVRKCYLWERVAEEMSAVYESLGSLREVVRPAPILPAGQR
jgi:glycosyltransferase involved in cell wall biosynthesis